MSASSAGTHCGYNVPSVKVPTTAMLACEEGNDLLAGSGICLGCVGSATGGRRRPTRCLIANPVISTRVTGTATYTAFQNGRSAPRAQGIRQRTYQSTP